ncbi:MAG: metallophosphoesterase, partial [Pseudomonadota bacterium]
SRAAYERFAAHFAELGVPVYCLPGNHDRLSLMYELLDDEPFQTLGSAVIEDWCIALLDSTVPGSAGGTLPEKELTQLDRLLSLRPAPHVLVCLHHHPVASGSRWLDTVGLDNANAFFEVVHQYDLVRGVLWGHVHQPYDRSVNGIRLLGSPSTGAQFLPNSATFALADSPPGYRWLDLKPDGTIDTGVALLTP